jgi:hypothetical protein
MEFAQRFRTENTEIDCQLNVDSCAVILNMGIGGVSVKTNFKLNTDNVYPLEVEDHDHNLKLEATSVWSNVTLHREESGNHRCDFIPVHTAGMRFSHTSKDKVNEIVNYIEKHKQRTDKRSNFLEFSDRRHGSRSPINGPRKCSLNFSVNCRVHELGMGGMLIKSGHELENGSRLLATITLSGGEPLKIPGRVISCSFIGGTDTGQVFDTGLEFTEISDAYRERIKRLVRTTIVSNSVRKLRTGIA